MAYKNYLFDLDGTLTDPGLGITNSILYALKKQGFPLLPRQELYKFIGPPLLESFQQYCGATKEQSQSLVTAYREYFTQKGMFENVVYNGIPAVLSQLKEQGAALYVATSKPEPFAKQILEHFDLAQYFTFIGGSTLDETRTKKEEVIDYVLKENGLDPRESIMVGDRYYDIEGARCCGLAVAAVLFGYGDREELKTADHLIETPKELLDI